MVTFILTLYQELKISRDGKLIKDAGHNMISEKPEECMKVIWWDFLEK
jgi:hypothetical protein